MRPLTWMAPGLVLVAVDFRLLAVDLLFDPLGWLMIAIGAWQIARPATVTAVGVAGLASFVDVLLPYRWVQIHPETGRVVEQVTTTRYAYPEVLIFDRVSGVRLVLLTLAFAAAGVALWMLLRDLTERAKGAGRTTTAKQLGLLRGLVPGLWVGPYLLGAVAAVGAGGSFDPVWNGGLAYVALVGLVPMLWLAGLLAWERDRAWALPRESASPPPWLPWTRARARASGWPGAAAPPEP
jgi:hypothetical protein